MRPRSIVENRRHSPAGSTSSGGRGNQHAAAVQRDERGVVAIEAEDPLEATHLREAPRDESFGRRAIGMVNLQARDRAHGRPAPGHQMCFGRRRRGRTGAGSSPPAAAVIPMRRRREMGGHARLIHAVAIAGWGGCHARARRRPRLRRSPRCFRRERSRAAPPRRRRLCRRSRAANVSPRPARRTAPSRRRPCRLACGCR